MFFQCINILQVPWEVLKTAAFGLGFQHLPRDLANVNAWKTLLDPYINLSSNTFYLSFNQCFFHKNGNRRFQYVVIGYKDTYFIRDHSDAPQKYSDADVIKMLEYLIDNIFVEFGGRIFQQTIGIPMGTNCAPLLADLFLYSYEAEFVQSILQAGKKHLAQQFNFTYRYIDDVLSLKNTKFAEYLEFIYPRELEIKETTETSASSSYLDCYLYIDNGKLTTRLYDKRDDFNFSHR